MQTFLPYPSYKESARVLDWRRLGKQRVEAYQILRALTEESYGWRNHPATKMWSGYEKQLSIYGIEICKEWKKRGYRDSLLPKFESYKEMFKDSKKPEWLGNEDFHSSHRSNLLRKDFSWYSQYNWREEPTMEYVWPTQLTTSNSK
jgi:hypothetical protein